MRLVNMTCPNCGAQLQVDADRKQIFCEHCGTRLLIQEDIQHIRYDNAEDAGYQFEKGRQRAKAELQEDIKRVTTPPTKQKPTKKKRRTWLWVLGWIFIFPVPVTILMLRKKELKPIIKYGIIAIAWIIYLGISATGNSDKTTTETSSSSTVKETIEEMPSTTIEEKKEDIQSDVITEVKSEEVSNIQENNESSETPQTIQEPVQETDMDIILRAGHPTYYGSVEQSHKVWDDVEDGKIHFGDKSYGHNDTPILTMDAYRQSDIIRTTCINFYNFSDNQNVTIDEAIHIASTYMPYEIMDQYYEYRGSEMIVPDEGKRDGSTYYTISYSLTEEAGDAYYKKEHEYSGSIDVIIQSDNEIVTSINITFGKPRWMYSLSQNSYHTEEWSCDLYDYRN